MYNSKFEACTLKEKQLEDLSKTPHVRRRPDSWNSIQGQLAPRYVLTSLCSADFVDYVCGETPLG